MTNLKVIYNFLKLFKKSHGLILDFMNKDNILRRNHKNVSKPISCFGEKNLRKKRRDDKGTISIANLQ